MALSWKRARRAACAYGIRENVTIRLRQGYGVTGGVGGGSLRCNCGRPRTRARQSGKACLDSEVLNASTFGCPGVWNPCKGHHCIQRNVNSRQRRFQEMIELFLRAECARRGFVAHLDKIL